MKRFFAWIKRYISPVFVMLFVASFILWYIAKLGYTYTTDYTAKLNINGHHIDVPCVVEGVGTNLLNYKYKLGKRIRVTMDELDYRVSYSADSVRVVNIRPASLQKALSVRISDIKIISVGEIPSFPEAAVDKSERLD
ncbi:MAG: hypothetical protein J1E04_04185 [Alistipes sp.]|nr:hypothetical protein [Alistipes sp.]